MATNDETKEQHYPGKLDDWNELTELFRSTDDPATKALYAQAAQLAGLAYMLDGIRYAMRKGGGQ